MTWTNPDVTPVGVARDAAGRAVSRHRRGWMRILVGTALLIGGIALAVADPPGVRQHQVEHGLDPSMPAEHLAVVGHRCFDRTRSTAPRLLQRRR